jgi:hypothetical protein
VTTVTLQFGKPTVNRPNQENSMKVVAFNGSARKDGNTAILIGRVFSALEAEGIETELVQLAGKTIRGCIACGKCFKNQDKRCAVTNDFANECIERMCEAAQAMSREPIRICSGERPGRRLSPCEERGRCTPSIRSTTSS